MQLPPADVLRAEPAGRPPLVVRGGTVTLSDAHLANQVRDCWERHPVLRGFCVRRSNDDLGVLSREVRAVRIRPVIRTARCGSLRSAGFGGRPSRRRPRHIRDLAGLLWRPAAQSGLSTRGVGVPWCA